MGNPDLSPGEASAEPRRGLVIFPAETLRPPSSAPASPARNRNGRRRASWLGEWGLVIAALALGAAVVAAALLLR